MDRNHIKGNVSYKNQKLLLVLHCFHFILLHESQNRLVISNAYSKFKNKFRKNKKFIVMILKPKKYSCVIRVSPFIYGSYDYKYI